ncbi:MAG: HD domain-containing protein, partial [Spirochaetes bacterium]|nr:HD domain-containing protein [Spirochaetota bacterium]
ITDPYHGMNDLKKKLIRAVGDPMLRFKEDGLRLIRACRFAGQLEFKIEKDTFDAVKKRLDNFTNISVERIKDEIIKIMKAPKPSLAFESMRTSGLLEMIIPELLEGFGVEQNEFHKYDIYYHNLYSCDAASQDSYIIRLAALFHDIGKMRSMRNVEKKGGESGNPVFYNHELIGARMTERILRRLKFSNSDREKIIHLIKNHMFHYTNQWTDGAVRRFMRKVGLENISSVFKLREADRAGNGKKHGPAKSLARLKKRIDAVIEAENAITVKDLKINGYDIMEVFSIKPGRIIGDILDALLEEILDDPEKNERDTLLSIAKAILKIG